MAYSISVTSWQTTNEATNQSTVYAYLTLTATNQGYSGYTTSGNINIGGQNFGFGGPGALNTDGVGTESWQSSTYSRTYDHLSNGERGTVATSGSFAGGGGYSPGSLGPVSGATQPALNYDRRPGNASFASIYRSNDDIYVGQNGVSSPASGLVYYTQRSQNGGAWGDQKTGTANWYANLPLGTTQQFRALTSNDDGDSAGGWQYSAVYSVPNIPSAPASITPSTPSALSCTVTTGVAPENGAGISAYYVQASPDNGTTWLSAQLMTNRSYTFTGLTPGATYKFRTYAVNEMGAGSVALSASTFVPAGGRRWNGTAWVPNQIARRWNGTAWVDLTTAKRWTGTAWVDLS